MKIEEFIGRHKILFGQIAAPVFIATGPVFIGLFKFWLIIFGFLCVILGVFWHYKVQQGLVTDAKFCNFLKLQRDDALGQCAKSMPEDGIAEHYFNMLKKSLRALMEEINIHEHHEYRISLYVHDKDHFMLLSRYSDNPEFSKVGRSIYPDSQGILGLAWQKGEYCADSFPDPSVEENLWIEMQKKRGGIKDENIPKHFKMKSREYFACALREPQEKNKIAVLVLESTLNKSLNLKKVRKLIKSPKGEVLNELLVQYKRYSPQASFAKKAGL
jgi:hypothetical protein